VQVVLVGSALLADAVALWAIAARITELGFTPNRVAALGENVILLVNLAWSAVLYVRFLRGRGSFTALEKWQTDYLPVYGAWAAIVVILFPPLFRYLWTCHPIHILAGKGEDITGIVAPALLITIVSGFVCNRRSYSSKAREEGHRHKKRRALMKQKHYSQPY
jgi:hypothetical protein